MAIKVIGVKDLRDRLAPVLAELREVEEVVVTERGEGRAVLVDLERYNDLVDRLEFLEDSVAALEAEREGAVPVGELE